MKTMIIVTLWLYLPSSIFAFSTAYFEAEDFTSQIGGNKASSEYFPYIGEGYLEMGGQGATVTWNKITVPKAGKYTLLLKYANNTQHDLSCDLKVNDAFIKNIPFGPFQKTWTVPWPAATEYKPETVGWAKYWNTRVIVDLKAGANTLELMATSEHGGPHIDNIAVSTALSEPPAPIVNVRDYGAVGDGKTDNTEAIAKAIAACPAGGSVVFDGGVYMTGSITLKANMTLWVSEQAVIRAIPDNDKIQVYPEGAFSGRYITKYFLFGNQVDHLTITGGGTIDLNTTKRLPGRANVLRPSILGWVNSENVTVTNVDLINGDFWAFVPQTSDHIIIDGINLFNLNKDGIDPLDCHDISITNSVISAGDDALTPKSYRAKGIDKLVVKNLTINHCKWKGIKFGFSSIGDFTHCWFEDIAMVHVQAGITVLLIDGGSASNLVFNRIHMNNVYTPITLLNGGGLRSKAPGITSMKDIHISNLEARNVYNPMGSFITGTKVGDIVHKVENITLTNVKVESFKGGLTEVPGTPIEYDGRKADVRLFGNFPAWGYYIRHADNVVFNNVTHSVAPADVRKDIVLEDVTGFKNIGQNDPVEWTETESEYHARMKPWNDARFGLFMHWGLYAAYGGEYKGTDFGKECANASAEHIFKTGDIPVEEYRQTARNFNPDQFDADEWVKMAKDAGMKYMVLTAKHHDGFGLFDSKASDWNIVHASDYKKDLIKAFVDACHKAGMLVGFYYSHNADWFHHQSSPRQSRPAPCPQSMPYKEFVMIQLKELLTHYGKIDILWFDTPSKTDIEFNKSCAAMVRKYQPNCIINGRIGHNLGDYISGGDRAVVEPGKQGYKESIMTMRLNWGYDKNDDFWKSSDELIAMLSQSACRGSNFMLNIGPTAQGTFPPEDRARLKAIGQWMKRHGEAIYSTEGSPFAKEYAWGSFTFNPDTRKVYLHLYNWTGGDITVTGIDSRVAKATFLDSGEGLEFSQDSHNELKIRLPLLSREKGLRIIALELEGDLKFDPSNGPDFIPPTIHQLKFRKITGTIKNLGPCEFQVDGKMTFTLNDHVRYRVNRNGDIRKVPGYDLREDKTYQVVYSPYPDEPVVEIITLFENVE